MDASNTAFVMNILCMLMMGLMWLGLVTFNCGMVRSKNVCSCLLKQIVGAAIASIVYLLWFSPLVFNHQSAKQGWQLIIPKLHWTEFLNLSVSGNTQMSMQIIMAGLFLPSISLAIIAGISSERLKLWSFALFALLFTLIIFPVSYYWQWWGGYLQHIGFIDHAGSASVFLTAAISGFVVLLLVGKRSDSAQFKKLIYPASNIPLVAIGTGLVIIGAMGLHVARHSLESGDLPLMIISITFMKSFVVSCSGLLAALIVSSIVYGFADLTFASNGAFAAIAAFAVTPSSISLGVACLFGAGAGVLAIIFIVLLRKAKLDDPTGHIGSFGFGSLYGLLVGACTVDYTVLSKIKGEAWNAVDQLWAQLQGIIILGIWILVSSALIWMLIRLLFGLRISPKQEALGLDVLQCGMTAYPEFTQVKK